MTSEELFNKYYYLVERFTERYSLDEDGPQELALYFWECVTRYTGTTAASTYFGSCLESKASHYVEPSVQQDDAIPTPLLAGYCVIYLEQYELQSLLETVCESLTEQQRLYVWLHYGKGYSCAQIAREYNKSITWIIHCVRKGLRRMRKSVLRHQMTSVLRDNMHRLGDTTCVVDNCAYI